MRTNETLEQKIARVTAEEVSLSEYDPAWPLRFEEEKARLADWLPTDLIIRIEHFGSTAVPGLAAKPVVDMLIEITDPQRGKTLIPEALEPKGYDCFWRPVGNENVPPYYTWCIRRGGDGGRTHHLHFVERGFMDRELRFRDILRENPDVAEEYRALKYDLCSRHGRDRIEYTRAKGGFIARVLEKT